MNRYNKKNYSSYGYGFKAKVIKGIGVICTLVSIFMLSFTFNPLWLIGIGVALWLMYQGSKREYNFQRSGGYIVYNN